MVYNGAVSSLGVRGGAGFGMAGRRVLGRSAERWRIAEISQGLKGRAAQG